ncbi:MAG: hypothetical protein ACREQ5_12590 [Candidatus Dormibacteria bacterium]
MNTLLPSALAAAQVFHAALPALRPGMYFDHLYLHWAVEPFGHLDGAYNAEVDLEGGEWVLQITHNPLDNAVDITDGPYAAHTYSRNSHAFGLAVAGMDGATSTNFGEDGLQLHEIEYLCAAAAAVCWKYDLDAMGQSSSRLHPGPVIETHATAAIKDLYYPGDGDPDSRWDLAILAPQAIGAPFPSKTVAEVTAAALRLKIHNYKAALMTAGAS